VLTAGDGAQALEVATRHPGPIHLLISDVVMPHMGGYELARRLAERRPQAKVLYVSGYTTRQLLPATALAGGAGFLQKPFSEDTLTLKVREVLGAPRSTPP
jgi:CheY-like chemotaxis protein